VADREGICLDVVDEGPGIAEAERERIFEKFHRADERDHRRAGTGLGLAIARGFVEALGGSISVSNRTDRNGARFSVRLPERLYVPAPSNEAAE
jgi:two-component system sensor histidine kinase KdpD